MGSPCLETLLLGSDQSKLLKLYNGDHGFQLSSGGDNGNDGQVVQCQECGDQCLGVMGYMMHMDHHIVHGASPECPQCMRKGFPTICQFYNHSCSRPETKYCASCDEMRVLETWRPSPVSMDILTLRSKAADLAREVNNFTPDTEPVNKHLQELDDEEVDLVFHNSFNLQFAKPSSSKTTMSTNTVVDITDL